MSASINFTNTPQTSNSGASSSSSSHSHQSTNTVWNSLSTFVHEIPDDETRLTAEQKEAAKRLKEELLAHFTPEKLFQLIEVLRKAANEYIDGPLYPREIA